MTTKKTDHLKTLTAIMIAILSLVGALLTRRIIKSTNAARQADLNGLDAVRNVQVVLAFNNTLLHRHYRAYTDYTVQDELRTLIADSPAIRESDLGIQALANAANLAATNQLFFPSRYHNRDGSYAIQRELSEAWAQAQQAYDLDPDAHFTTAQNRWQATRTLAGLFIGIPLGILCFKLAQDMAAERRILRVVLIVAGTGLLVFILTAIMIVDRLV